MMDQLKYYVDFIPVVSVIVAMVLTWLVTAIAANIRWKRILKHYMPDAAKHEIGKLEQQNRELRESLDIERRARKAEQATMRAVRSALDEQERMEEER